MINYNFPKFEDNSRICFLGDSIMAGSIMIEQLFEYYLKKFPKSNIRMYNCAVGGGTADFGLEHSREDLCVYNPTHVFFMYSANDVYLFNGLSDTEIKEGIYKNFKITIEDILSHGIKVYFGISLRNRDDETINKQNLETEVMRRVADEYGFPCIDFHDFFYETSRKTDIYNSDGIHPNMLGQTVMAKYLLYKQGFEEFNPAREDFLEEWTITGDGDLRYIYGGKLRQVWGAVRAISTIGDTMEAKVERLKGRLKTRGDGMWDDYSYFRAVDFIELAPHYDFYKEMYLEITEKMVNEAIKNADEN